MATQQFINRLTFQDAQAMYARYDTLKPEHILYEDLLRILSRTALPIDNVRAFYNNAILKYYPNEATIKAEFLKKVLFRKKHDITVFELPVGKSRVDLCKVNGTSIAYEIKTDLDSLKRLDKQISDYQLVFEQVYVICSIFRLAEIQDSIPADCGIYAYSSPRRGCYKFEEVRKAISSTQCDAKQQLNVFWASELKRAFPKCANMRKDEAINSIVDMYSSTIINEAFKETLKSRFCTQWSFLENNHKDILEIDYQWFYQSLTSPDLIYGI
ncbi:MAG: sce7726 family protein [Christensenellaceae bacterium]